MSALRKEWSESQAVQPKFEVINGGLSQQEALDGIQQEMESKGFSSKAIAAATAFATSMMSGAVMAAGEADAAVTAITTDGTAAISAVGGALIGLAALAIIFKWIKGAIFS